MSVCKYCQAPIGWTRIEGKWRPANADSSAHLCKAKTLNARQHIAGKLVVGANYTPSCGECNLPPWEECACSALLKVAA